MSIMLDQIVPWLNIGVFLILCILLVFFYTRSVSPAALEKKIGAAAYKKCVRYRAIASIISTLTIVSYIVYFFYPLPIPIPRYFSWVWWISFVAGMCIAIPSLYLWFRGLKDAGEETIRPAKGHRLYGGIYKRMRHPQAVGETGVLWAIAFLLHSPFLVVLSLIWIPIMYVLCMAEERDLVIRFGEPYIRYQKSTPFMIPRRKKARRV